MNRRHAEIVLLPRAGGAARVSRPIRAVVVGGGIAGVAAATILGERGVTVTLIEKQSVLGGRAAGFPTTIATGEQIEMERGFHAFFRQYYNLRALLRRVDPALGFLQPLDDYPILGPEGRVQTFRGLPTRTPWQVLALSWQSPHLRLADLARRSAFNAFEMVRYEVERTYARFDALSATQYLDSLGFPPMARRMLFDVFSHSSFNPEGDMSAGEMLMMFHFYFTGNPEGLIFDAACRPMSTAIWEPFAAWLPAHGVTVHTGCAVRSVERGESGGWRVEHDGGHAEAELLVLALDVESLHRVIDASAPLASLGAQTSAARATWPFAVWRLWLDRPVASDRPVFAGVTGIGLLDSIAVYDHLQDESIAWSRAHGGSVVELHAYAVPPERDEAFIRRDLLAGLHQLYPETRDAAVLDERFLLRQDCPAFPPGSIAQRPTVATNLPGVVLAGDCTSVPVPCALMERAAVSGILAANTLLATVGVAPEPIHSVPQLGLLAVRPRSAPARTGAPPAAPSTHDRGFRVRRSGALVLAGQGLPEVAAGDPRPDWQQASPAWIARALAHSQRLPSGGWYVLDASATIAARPRCVWVRGRALVVWRDHTGVRAGPDQCPHLGAALSDGCVRDGRLVCRWHGLALGSEGHGGWQPLQTHDDGILSWVRLDGEEAPTDAPLTAPRPLAAIDASVRMEARCDPCDVIANRLDPWHGTHIHPKSFGALRVIDRQDDEITVRVAFRVLGAIAVEADARFHCADPRTIVMTIVGGEGEGSMMETHVTPMRPGRTAIVEAVFARSGRAGFQYARRVGALVRPALRWSARRLWIDDVAYAERLWALRTVGSTARTPAGVRQGEDMQTS